ncbi:hypothetical protein V2G26_017538 [Clonostachys chloroleuca]
MRSRSAMHETVSESTPSKIHQKSTSSSKRPPFSKLQISDPEPVKKQWNSLKELSKRPGSVCHSVTRQSTFLHRPRSVPDVDNLKTFSYELAEPRLSPMEYTRMYFIEKSLSSREKRKCMLPEPFKLQLWTPNYDEFLIIPQLPPNIKRRVKNGLYESQSSNRPFFKIDRSPSCHITPNSNCPRISLNLGAMTSFFPSLLDLKSVGRLPDQTSEVTFTVIGESNSFAVERSRSWGGTGIQDLVQSHQAPSKGEPILTSTQTEEQTQLQKSLSVGNFVPTKLSCHISSVDEPKITPDGALRGVSSTYSQNGLLPPSLQAKSILDKNHYTKSIIEAGGNNMEGGAKDPAVILIEPGVQYSSEQASGDISRHLSESSSVRSILEDLQPAPLKIRRNTTRRKESDIRRCPNL